MKQGHWVHSHRRQMASGTDHRQGPIIVPSALAAPIG
jgi:hypothetical protein